jgi:hypothetical protein
MFFYIAILAIILTECISCEVGLNLNRKRIILSQKYENKIKGDDIARNLNVVEKFKFMIRRLEEKKESTSEWNYKNWTFKQWCILIVSAVCVLLFLYCAYRIISCCYC